jgi:hypothetical protein
MQRSSSRPSIGPIGMAIYTSPPLENAPMMNIFASNILASNLQRRKTPILSGANVLLQSVQSDTDDSLGE